MIVLSRNKKILEKIPQDLLNRWPNDVYVTDLEQQIKEGVLQSRCIVVVDGVEQEEVMKIMVTTGFRHVVQLENPAFLSEIEASACMISDPIRYLRRSDQAILNSGHHKRFDRDIKRSTEKDVFLEDLRVFLESLPGTRSICDSAITIADELFTNAMYNSPTHQSDGRKRNSKLNRTTEVELEDGEFVRFYCVTSEDRVTLGCTDSFGSLAVDRFNSSIYKSFKRGIGASINMGRGGAHIGTRVVFDLCLSMYVAVSRGKQTTVSVTLPLGKSLTKGATPAKNYHYLDREGEDMGEMTVAQNKNGGVLSLELGGYIDEDAQFAGIDLADVKEILFDLGKVTVINSCGIREWIRWTRQIPEGVKLSFANCSKVIVDQMNIVDGFLPEGSEVKSFFVPYYCESCENVTNLLYSNGKEFGTGDVNAAETTKCEHCGEEAELDIIAAKYFRFIGG